MKPKEILGAGIIATVATGATIAVGLAESGFFEEKPKATDESCMEVAEDSRPVEGACLPDKYADLDALRKECGGEITTVIKSCGCGGTRAPVWTCEGDE